MDMDAGLEHKFARFGDGLTVSEDAVIEGYASLFGQTDQGGDNVQAGAYAALLKALNAAGQLATVDVLGEAYTCRAASGDAFRRQERAAARGSTRHAGAALGHRDPPGKKRLLHRQRPGWGQSTLASVGVGREMCRAK